MTADFESTMPTDIGIVDTLLGIPSTDKAGAYDWLRPLLRDRESLEAFGSPVQYQYHDRPATPDEGTVDDMIDYTIDQMDQNNIWKALIDVRLDEGPGRRALERYPDRFFGAFAVDPNRGVPALRDLQHAVEDLGVKAAAVMPAFVVPQCPINDKRMYPVYAKCCELDIPVLSTTGVPGPRVPMAPQDVALIDEVCYFFPELRFVMRHGGEPWTWLAAKLLLKWPNLYYSTSAFAPKHYPEDIIKFANTRGADKVLYAGYFPAGLTLDRIFRDMPYVPFRENVWPKFLRENAVRVFKLDE
jgi:predicted TIM-barrel fold metal-dependent hydrolase